jgi:hypothetical protein
MATFDTKVERMHHLPGEPQRAPLSLLAVMAMSQLRSRELCVRDIVGPLLEGEIDRARVLGSELAASITHATT